MDSNILATTGMIFGIVLLVVFLALKTLEIMEGKNDI